MEKNKGRWTIFISTVFFVLGFSLVFSIAGVLLQSLLAAISFSVQKWLARIGGVIIIFFGLYLVGLIKPKFLQAEHKLQVKKKFNSGYLTSFLFGAAFAVGWTPCVGAILGAILTLAATEPSMAFALLFSYTLGLVVPFLIVGFLMSLSSEATHRIIHKSAKVTKYLSYIFGAFLIILGILVFADQLSRVANLAFAADFLAGLDISLGSGSGIGIGVSFIGGIISFFSPCILPLLPAFLTYLGSTIVKERDNNEK